MCAFALAFLGAKQLGAMPAAEQAPPFLAGDQSLSFTILTIQSFLFGVALAWIQRRRLARGMETTCASEGAPPEDLR